MEKHKDIWVVAEQNAGVLSRVSLELLSCAARLAGELEEVTGSRPGVLAVVTGGENPREIEELHRHGADGSILALSPLLEDYRTDLHAAVLADLVREKMPEIVLFGATAWGSEVAPGVAAKVKTGLAAHCADLKINPQGLLVQSVPAFGGKVLGEILCPDHRPQMASVRPGVFPAVPVDNPAPVQPVMAPPNLGSEKGRIKVLEVRRQEISGRPLEEAEVVVAGGWGVGSKENWQLLEELAELLGAAVGCTRPALDEGWTAGEHTMIGTSGKAVRPKVYVGFGISGATHHVVGIKDAGLVISINTNPRAEVFQYSDVKVVADARSVIDALIAELKVGKKD